MEKSNIDKLMELKQLYEQGILTKEEMETEKKKILGSVSDAPKSESPQIVERQLSVEVKETAKDSFANSKGYIWGGIALLLIIAGLIFVPRIISHSDNNPVSDEKIIEVSTPQILTLKGMIKDNIGFSMHLQCNGNKVEGKEHYDSQKSDVNVSIKGTIDENGYMILHEYDNNVESGKFEGTLDDISYSGTFTNSKGKSMSFSARTVSEEDLAKEEDAIKKIGSKGTVIAEVDGKIYYFDKLNSETSYESEGDNCGKLYIYDTESESTSSERILIPSGEMYSIEGYNYRDMKITFVLYDVGRNGFGIGNYCTEVSQYNVRTGKWRAIAEGCAKAEFVDNNRKIKITTATLINPEAEYAYEYKYEYSDEVIEL